MRILWIVILIIFVSYSGYAQNFGDMPTRKASKIKADTALFPTEGPLGASDTTVQNALQTLNQLLTTNTPSSTTSSCTPEQMAYTSGFLYICVASNTWERVAIATWAVTDKLLLDDGSSHLLLDDGSSKLLVRQ